VQDCRESGWDRYYRPAAMLVLALAAFNLFFRLDREIVTEWDEALYAISAAETAAHGNWIATTFRGALDYYNTKPPLNVWLIAASFQAFGTSLLTLRLASAAAAWTTVLVVLVWGRRAFGAATALLAGLVLSSTYGFIYVHSGRSANTDAVFTLLILLTVVTLWAARDRPWRLLWLGPIVAATFLLRGMAVIMPLVLIGAVVALGGESLRRRAVPLAASLALLVAPVSLWVLARWRIDGWEFIGRMVHYDFIARIAVPLEGHTGSLLYDPNYLQKDHYEWLIAAAAALLLVPVSRARLRELWRETTGNRYGRVLMGAWLGTTVVIPTLMQTKLAWYLNPFYPLFALVLGRVFAHGFS
jgi:4-amino-4-deoxy-L-arabinose transferase-like glycosyltransferase